MNSKDIRNKHKQYLFEAVKNYYKEPVVVSNAKGTRGNDMDGYSYLDFFGGILTESVGHANEEVIKSITTQVNHLTHISSLYPTVPVVELAERLANNAPVNLD